MKVSLTSRSRMATMAILACSALGAATPARAVPILGTAEGFAVLGASTVTNAGSTAIKGNIGVSPSSAITGIGSIALQGVTHAADATALQAKLDATQAYTSLTGLSFTSALTGQDLGGLFLTPGVYNFTTSAQLTGTLTLDFAHLSNQSFVFQIGTTLTTATGADIVVLNGDATDSIFFAVGSAATLGTATRFAGNIIAQQSITLTTASQITCGRAMALVGAVTMDTNRVSNDCTNGGDLGSARSDFGSAGFSGVIAAIPPPVAVSEPASMTVLAVALLGLAGFARRRMQG